MAGEDELFATSAVLAALLLALWNLVLRVSGVAAGVGLGLGLALHVRDTLDRWRELEEAGGARGGGGGGGGPRGKGWGDGDDFGGRGGERMKKRTDLSLSLSRQNSRMAAAAAGGAGGGTPGVDSSDRPSPVGSSSSSPGPGGGIKMFAPASMADRDSYQMLMLDAGYTVPNLLRGQILKSPPPPSADDASWRDGDSAGGRGRPWRRRPNWSNDCTRGPALMRELYPHLPPAVGDEIGRVMDLIMRDYVSVWYGKMDEGVRYSDAGIDVDGDGSATGDRGDPPDEGGGGGGAGRPVAATSSTSSGRTMVYSTQDLYSSPFMDVMYDSLAYLFGNFGVTVMDRVNLLHFLMVRVTEVLGKTLRVYRTMKDRAVQRAAMERQKHGLIQQQQKQRRPRREGAEADQRGGGDQRQGGATAELRRAVTSGRSASFRVESAEGGKGPTDAPAASSGSTPSAGTEETAAARNTGDVVAEAKVEATAGVSSTSERQARPAKGVPSTVATTGGNRPPSPERRGTEDASATGDGQPQPQPQPQGERAPPNSPPPGGDAAAAASPSSSSSSAAAAAGITQISEMAVAREFLLAGRLHRAITFGVDVPSLLFAQSDEAPFGSGACCPSSSPEGGESQHQRQEEEVTDEGRVGVGVGDGSETREDGFIADDAALGVDSTGNGSDSGADCNRREKYATNSGGSREESSQRDLADSIRTDKSSSASSSCGEGNASSSSLDADRTEVPTKDGANRKQFHKLPGTPVCPSEQMSALGADNSSSTPSLAPASVETAQKSQKANGSRSCTDLLGEPISNDDVATSLASAPSSPDAGASRSAHVAPSNPATSSTATAAVVARRHVCPICSPRHPAPPGGHRPRTSPASSSSSSDYSPDVLLYHRLCCSPLLRQSELDYNRVVASRLVGKLLPSREAQSFVIKSFGVEMLAGCILTPVMGLLTPDYVNGMIVSALSGYGDAASTSTSTSTSASVSEEGREGIAAEDGRALEDADGRQPKVHGGGAEPAECGTLAETAECGTLPETPSCEPRDVSPIKDVNGDKSTAATPDVVDASVEPDKSATEPSSSSQTSDEVPQQEKGAEQTPQRDDSEGQNMESNDVGDPEVTDNFDDEGDDDSADSSPPRPSRGSDRDSEEAFGESHSLPEEQESSFDDDLREEQQTLEATVNGQGELVPLAVQGDEVAIMKLVDDEVLEDDDDDDDEDYRSDDDTNDGNSCSSVATDDTEGSGADRAVVSNDYSDQLVAGSDAVESVKLAELDATSIDGEPDHSAAAGGTSNSNNDRESSASAEAAAERLLPLLTLMVIEVQNCTTYRNAEDEVDWGRPSARYSVCHLVLVIEAVILHGRRKVPLPQQNNGEEAEKEKMDGDEGETVATLSSLLMDVTTDMERFERLIEEESFETGGFVPDTEGWQPSDHRDDGSDSEAEAETSTLRTVIAAWLHTGNIYRILHVLISIRTLLSQHYNSNALLRHPGLAEKFVAQLKILDEQEVLVDTMSVLSADSDSLLGLSKQADDGSTSNSHERAVASKATKTQLHGVAPSRRSTSAPPSSSAAPRTGQVLKSFSSTFDRTTMTMRNSLERTNSSIVSVAAAATGNVNELLKGAPGNSTPTGSIPAPRLMTNVRASMSANRQRLSRWVTNANDGTAGTVPATAGTTTSQSPVANCISNSASVPKKQPPSVDKASTNNFATSQQPPISPASAASSPSLRAQHHSQQHHHHHHHHHKELPSHLDFRRNEAFASSLRSRRESGTKNWQNVWRSGIEKVSSSTKRGNQMKTGGGRSAEHTREFQNMHSLANAFYRSTVSVSLRTEPQDNEGNGVPVEKNDEEEAASTTPVAGKEDEGNQKGKLDDVACTNAVCMLEVVSSRRRIEVPDEDSSFLLRAQPRELTPLGVHRDQRNHDQSFKCYGATYEEAVTHPETNRYRGARRTHLCLLKYYPIDRTATVEDIRARDVAPGEPHHRDSPKAKDSASTSRGAAGMPSGLPERLRTERNLCQKTRGSGGVLSGSNAMEPSDFNCIPRTGRAIDFVYRMSLFERPVAEVAGRRFTVHDSSSVREHRADASARELSDAALSIAILTGGDIATGTTRGSGRMNSEEEDTLVDKSGKPVGSSDDPSRVGSVALKMKVNGVGEDGATIEQVKAFRPSQIRAALLVTSARQEAQLQCLIYCVKAGSARQATKARAELMLQPTLSLLEYASSRKRDREQIILRDLGIGITHIDREQLRRNGIIDARYPNFLRRLKVRVEDVVHAKTAGALKPTAYYKIHVAALSEETLLTSSGEKSRDENTGEGESDEELPQKEEVKKYYREDWVVLRPFRDFVTLHKHLKSQVGETAPRFGAFGAGGGQKKGRAVAIIPSLSQATKAVAIPTGRKNLERRKDVLNQYFQGLLSPNHLLSTCPELLRFLAADEPLHVDDDSSTPRGGRDLRGRSERRKTLLKSETGAHVATPEKVHRRILGSTQSPPRSNARDGSRGSEGVRSGVPGGDRLVANKANGSKKVPVGGSKRRVSSAVMAFIRSRVDEVKLGDVRNAVFEMVRHLFNLDNATFWRSRMFSAIKTMSFVVTGAQEFNKLLVKLHLDYLTGEKVGGMVRYLRETIWPNGVFYTPSEESTEAEKLELERSARDILPKAFPDQLRTVLGQELSNEGLSMLHEMLQNRIVVKSLGYTLVDLVLVEIFPGLSDVLSGTKALDFED